MTKIEAPRSDEREDGEEKPDPDFSAFKGERLPVVHFEGDSRSLHASWDPNANSKIRGTHFTHFSTSTSHSPLPTPHHPHSPTPLTPNTGTVRQTPHGAIRWTTFSIFHGEERWRSEGVQIGGLRSARGVLGNWFDKDFDAHGPAGPTAFWKESGSFEEGGGVRAFF